MDWDEHLAHRRTRSLDEIRGEIYQQSGVGRPPAGRPARGVRYVEDEQALADLRQAMGAMDD